MQAGAQSNIGQNNLVPKLGHLQAMLLAMSVETIRTQIKRDHSQSTQAFGKLLIHKEELEEYPMRTRGASGQKPTGRLERTPPSQPLPTPRAVGRPKKGALWQR